MRRSHTKKYDSDDSLIYIERRHSLLSKKDFDYLESKRNTLSERLFWWRHGIKNDLQKGRAYLEGTFVEQNYVMALYYFQTFLISMEQEEHDPDFQKKIDKEVERQFEEWQKSQKPLRTDIDRDLLALYALDKIWKRQDIEKKIKEERNNQKESVRYQIFSLYLSGGIAERDYERAYEWALPFFKDKKTEIQLVQSRFLNLNDYRERIIFDLKSMAEKVKKDHFSVDFNYLERNIFSIRYFYSQWMLARLYLVIGKYYDAETFYNELITKRFRPAMLDFVERMYEWKEIHAIQIAWKTIDYYSQSESNWKEREKLSEILDIQSFRLRPHHYEYFRQLAEIGDSYAWQALQLASEIDVKAAIIVAGLYENGNRFMTKEAYTNDLENKLKNSDAKQKIFLGDWKLEQIHNRVYQFGKPVVSDSWVNKLEPNSGFLAANPIKAIEYYKKAVALGSKEAIEKLSSLYKAGNVDPALSAMQNFDPHINEHEIEEFKKFVTFVSRYDIKDFAFELATIYRKHPLVKDLASAVLYLFMALRQNDVRAQNVLKVLTTNTEIEDQLLIEMFNHSGPHFFNQKMNLQFDSQIAYYFAHIAYKRAIPGGKEKMVVLAESGFVKAQYLLAQQFERDNQREEALYWAIQATQSDADLKEYHKHPRYLEAPQLSPDLWFALADRYERGDGVNKDMDRARAFYQRAYNEGHLEATLRLAQCHHGHDAFKFYLEADKRCHPKALIACERWLEGSRDKELLYEFGRYYAEQKKVLFKAMVWYQKSAEENYSPAIDALKKLTVEKEAFLKLIDGLETNQSNSDDLLTHAEQMTDDPRILYLIATKYYATRQEWIQVANLCMQVAEKQYAPAWDFLTTAEFSIDVFLHVAKSYEDGRGVIKNRDHADFFYLKAAAAGACRYYHYLGDLYDRGIEGELELNHQKAKEYFYDGAKAMHSESLIRLERIVQAESNPEWLYKVATIYEITLNDKIMALSWYWQAAQQGYQAADARLRELSLLDPEFAYEVAITYDQEEASSENDRQKALYYYAVAYRLGHAEAEFKLKMMVELEDPGAQYALGYHYYHANKQWKEAAYWCMKAAEKNHPDAKQYLRTTDFPVDVLCGIAFQYANGSDDVKKDTNQAITFYKKSLEKGYQKADLEIAYLYEANDNRSQANKEYAVMHYLDAAKHGSKEAVTALKRLSQEVISSRWQQTIGDFFNARGANSLEAAHSYELAAQSGNHTAKIKLEQTKNTTVKLPSASFFKTKLPPVNRSAKNPSEAVKKELEIERSEYFKSVSFQK